MLNFSLIQSTKFFLIRLMTRYSIEWAKNNQFFYKMLTKLIIVHMR